MGVSRSGFCVLFLLMFFYDSLAHATSCIIPGPESRIKGNEIIFKGKAVSQKQITDVQKGFDGYNRAEFSTKFEVSTVYKGLPVQTIELIQMRDPWGDAGLQIGREYIIFTDKNLKVYYCNPFIDLGYSPKHGGASRFNAEIKALERMKSEIEALESKARSSDRLKDYLEFGQALEEYHDYIRAENLYETLLNRPYAAQAKGSVSWWGARPAELGEKCKEKFAESEGTPEFLKTSRQDKFRINPDLLMRYSRSLVRQKKYEKALRPLCFAADVFGSEAARNLRVLALFHTGNGAEITAGPYDLSGEALGKLDVTGRDLTGWNFSNSSVYFLGENTRFDGAHFKGALLSGKISNSSFKDANLAGAKLRVQMDNVDFTRADLSRSEISGGALTNIKFNNVDLSHARIHADTANDIDFSNANMTKVTIGEYFGSSSGQNISLNGANLEGAVLGGIKLENVNFGEASLKNTNFSARAPFSQKRVTTLYGSEMSGVKEIETATFDGALYDCKTKFPKDFNAEAFLTRTSTAECPEPQAKTSRFSDHEEERKRRHQNAPYKGKLLKGYSYTSGDNLDGARLTAAVKLPPDALRFKLIPTSIINGRGSPWEFSNVGRSQGTCAEEPFLERYSSYRPPDIQIPDLSNMDLSFLELYSAWLPGANLSSSQLMHTDFGRSNFVGASFTKADMEGASLFNSVADNADFSYANLRNADLRLTRLRGAKFEGADLAGAIYDVNTMWPDGFDPVKAGAKREAPRNPYGSEIVMFPDERERFAKFIIPALPKNAEMHGIGAYATPSKSKDVFVSVTKTDVPLVLVFNGSGYLTWHLDISPLSKIAAVIVMSGHVKNIHSGVKVYNYQEISPRVPVVNTSKCGRSFDSYQDALSAITGKEFTRYLGARDFFSSDPGSDAPVRYLID